MSGIALEGDNGPVGKPLTDADRRGQSRRSGTDVRELKNSGLDVEIDTVSTREEFVEKIRSEPMDMVLSDYRMPGWTGMDAFSEIVKSGQDIPLILVTGTLGDLKAVECIKIGMADYVLKQQLARLPMAILRAQEGKLLRDAEKESRGRATRRRGALSHAGGKCAGRDRGAGHGKRNVQRLQRERTAAFRLTRGRTDALGPGN